VQCRLTAREQLAAYDPSLRSGFRLRAPAQLTPARLKLKWADCQVEALARASEPRAENLP